MMEKICTVLGTRPEIIRLSRVIPKIDNVAHQVIIHTGQNYDTNLNDIFFDGLNVRKPDYFLDARGSFGQQIGIILAKGEEVLLKEKPDKFLVLGDTNSSLLAIAAKRLGIPVYHMEAGNRCHDDRVPEETNRRLIDHSSTFLMPYTQKSRDNLLKEGIPSEKIYVTGNPINEVLSYYSTKINNAWPVLARFGIAEKGYFLVTLHRAENVDISSRLVKFITALKRLKDYYSMPIVFSVHPHTKRQLEKDRIDISGLITTEPLGLFDFVLLEKNAFCVLSDSGTVSEETCIFGVPLVTLRDTTERPETVDCGANIISGSDPDTIQSAVKIALASGAWVPPTEYLRNNVSDTVLKVLFSYQYRGEK